MEYLIHCDLPADARCDELLDNPSDEHGWLAFTASRSEDGFYFCDHGRSAAAAVAFRRLIDFALQHASRVTAEEP